jgi:hypothetical protein
LSLFESVPELLRSIVGEAGKYPMENQEALGRGIYRVNQILASTFEHLALPISSDRLISLINSTLLGYATVEMTTTFHGLWTQRSDFVDSLVQLVLSQPILPSVSPVQTIDDLPASMVQTILQRAQKKGSREWALVYLLFGSGVSAMEITRLERAHYLSDRDAQFLQITTGAIRQIPINQWILGKRYGNYQKNPLTQWLKGRKDHHNALFIGLDENPMTLEDIQSIWQELTAELLTPTGNTPTIDQAQQTWCVEMLMRGINVEDLQILTGQSIEQLAPYGKRAREKSVLEKGLALDKSK